VVSVVCCQVEVSETGCSPSTGVLSSVMCLKYDRKTSIIKRPSSCSCAMGGGGGKGPTEWVSNFT